MKVVSPPMRRTPFCYFYSLPRHIINFYNLPVTLNNCIKCNSPILLTALFFFRSWTFDRYLVSQFSPDLEIIVSLITSGASFFVVDVLVICLFFIFFLYSANIGNNMWYNSFAKSVLRFPVLPQTSSPKRKGQLTKNAFLPGSACAY